MSERPLAPCLRRPVVSSRAREGRAGRLARIVVLPVALVLAAVGGLRAADRAPGGFDSGLSGTSALQGIVMPARPVAPQSPSSDRALPNLGPMLDAYEAKPISVVPVPEDQLRPLLEALRASAPAWMAAAGESQAPRRRLAVATFVLEVLWSESDALLWMKGQPADDLLEWACSLIRKGPPPESGDPGEHLWFVASIALLERSGGSSLPPAGVIDTIGFTMRAIGQMTAAGDSSVSQMLRYHLEDAKARVPDEPRWALVQGMAEELRSWPDWRDDVALNVQPVRASATEVAYELALADPQIRQEALVRLGDFELRLGLTAKALDYFQQAGAPTDPYVAYWLHLFEGSALERVKRPAEAVAEYRKALAIAPLAQTASVALGSALLTGHQAAEATALMGQLLTSPPRTDPWTIYTFPDWRYLPDAMTHLRKLVRR
jgi:hypothetical protein